MVDLSHYHKAEREFFRRKTLKVAKSILGAYLVHDVAEGRIGGMIVEAEAYLSYGDPGCHAWRGMTPRNRAMFGPPGYAYTYFTYGNHWMFNVVTEEEGLGCAVLIRALEPVEGVGLMWENRKKARREVDLTNGPGKLASALRIGREQYGMDVVNSALRILIPGREYRRKVVRNFGGIVRTTRIGLKEETGADLPYRFYMAKHPSVSVKVKKRGSGKVRD